MIKKIALEILQKAKKLLFKVHTIHSTNYANNPVIEEKKGFRHGFVDKFAELLRLWKEIETAQADIAARCWTPAYPHTWETNSIADWCFRKIFSSKSCSNLSWMNTQIKGRERGS